MSLCCRDGIASGVTVGRMQADTPSEQVIALFDLRFERIAALKNGWNEGTGEAPHAGAVAKAREVIDMIKARNIALPFVFPAEDGSVLLEWRHSNKEWDLTLTCSEGRIQLADVFVEDPTTHGKWFHYIDTDEAITYLSKINDLIGHTGSGVTVEEIQHILEVIAITIELANGNAFDRAEAAGMAFLLTWSPGEIMTFAGDLAIVAQQALESRNAFMFDAYLDAARPKLDAGLLDPSRVEALLGEPLA